VTLSVSQFEVGYHQQRLLSETRVKEDKPVAYVDLESSFNCDFHRLDALEQKACLGLSQFRSSTLPVKVSHAP
jgi:hypothetical protein